MTAAEIAKTCDQIIMDLENQIILLTAEKEKLIEIRNILRGKKV